MPFDGFTTSALVAELAAELLRGRVDHIAQPYSQDLVLTFRQPGRSLPLYLSADHNFPRLHLAQKLPKNPTSPPSFCMLLRKYLVGAKLVAIEQLGFERIVKFQFQVNPSPLILAIELMGRFSNIILYEAKSGLILDCIKHVPRSTNRFRELIPGAPYLPPPKGARVEPEALSREMLTELLASSSSRCAQLLSRSFIGISPFLAQELVVRSGAEPDSQAQAVDPARLWASWEELRQMRRENAFEPVLCNGDFAALTPKSCAATPAPSLSFAIEETIGKAAKEMRLEGSRSNLRRIVGRNLKRTRRKIEAQSQELAQAEDREQYRIYGEMLKANLQLVKPGMEAITVPNYYDPELREITIPLDPSLCGVVNAEHYFHRYNKLKKGQQKIQRQLARSKAELAYLESVAQSLVDADFTDLDAIEAELRGTGYLPQKKREVKLEPSRPRRYRLGELQILVGRNNYQNDELTKKAQGDDLWLHTKEIPGSHVVIRPGTEDPEVIQVAAEIAAYFSQAREGQNVPVDYTLVKHVHKPRGARPGFVIYKEERTLFVKPQRHAQLEVGHET